MYVDIDSIVRQELIHQGLSIHWYFPFLQLSLKCVNDLSKDIDGVLNNIKSVRLTVGPDKSVSIPSDYVDWIRVGKQYGAYIRPLIVNPSLNKLENNETSTGAYSAESDAGEALGWGLYYYSGHISDYGEHLGGFYGYGNGGLPENSFQVVRERNEIQLHPSFSAGDIIVLDYLSFTADSVTAQVHKYAEEAIGAYIDWQYNKMQLRNRQSRLDMQLAERRYYQEVGRLVSRMTDWNIPTIKDAIRYSMGQAPKL